MSFGPPFPPFNRRLKAVPRPFAWRKDAPFFVIFFVLPPALFAFVFWFMSGK
jgi:hypothetical protein